MSEDNKTLNDEELSKVTGGAAGDDISYCGYSVKENGVYSCGLSYIFVVSLNSTYGGQTLDTLHRTMSDGAFNTSVSNHLDSLMTIVNGYQFVCISSETAFKNAKNLSEL